MSSRTRSEFLDDAWRRMAGSPLRNRPQDIPDPAILDRTEWVPEFERLMKNRLIMGSFRYGRTKDMTREKHDLSIRGAQARLEKYREDGNLEHLIDAANLAMLAFAWRKQNGGQVQASDDGEYLA